MDAIPLYFGVELELILEPTKKVWNENFLEVAEHDEMRKRERLVEIIKSCIPDLEIMCGDTEEAARAKEIDTFYKNWTVVGDTTLRPVKNQCKYSARIPLRL